ncbi:hypothetical protein GCM10022210_27140 [Mucilaginibacter dorajii]|uniref:Glycosyltransferase subfamily 4-like N-terminal domain-containing protein n=2 Tax=Mucilaginibacter dorajii TaxID=692994 RepID=A0ABP7Q238_9SPHI
MQRVRMSLPYFAENGWDAEVVTVDENFSDLGIDTLLLQSIPAQIKIHKVKALKKTLTSKLGLGSIALRSLWFYKREVDKLLSAQKFDLIYFSTTQFPVCILGAHWKKKFNIPYVIDMQDPWFSDYYRDKPKSQRPPKYWFSYRLNKYMEPIAMKTVDGLISVSEAYITKLKNSYPSIKNIPSTTITFGAFEPDMAIAEKNEDTFTKLLKPDFKNVVYIGRGGHDMYKAITPLFQSLKEELAKGNDALKTLRFYFIGTSYAASGQGTPTVIPLAKQFDIHNLVIEMTDRISYYHTLVTLQQADAFFIPGSDDPQYTASKIYPYLLTRKPLLAIFNKASSVIPIMKAYGVKAVYDYDSVASEDISKFLLDIINSNTPKVAYNAEMEVQYSAKQMTLTQCALFNQVLNGKN